ncbi:MAG TPA: hypothetical protein VHH36_05215 [Candidatus Thermoplasmatota archaeon]|nr:hypothetical protein [Candidatus Thermoplasmatota archaeon]
MRPGDEVILRDSGERLTLVAPKDAGGTLLVEDAAGDRFEVDRTEVMTLAERHGGCGCCGA